MKVALVDTFTADQPQSVTASRRPRSLGQLVAAPLRRLGTFAEPASRGYIWLLTAILVGSVPLLVAYCFSSTWHQFVTALLLSLVCLPLVWQDQWLKGVAMMALTFAAHSCVAIWLSHADPIRAARIFPDCEEYWLKQRTWITTGVDPEYELSAWIPAHLQLLGGTTLSSFTSFGTITFHRGFYEVDLMNYYNGRLLSQSRDPARSLLLGWHLWSILRGIGYTMICYEVISLSLQFFARRTVVSGRIHLWRLAAGLGFLVGDGALKATVMESVRLQLFENLIC